MRYPLRGKNGPMPHPAPARLAVRRRWPWPDLADALPGHVVEEAAPLEEVRARRDTPGGDLAAAGARLEHVAVEQGGGAWREAWSLHLPGGGAPQVWEGPRDRVPPEAERLVRGLARGRDLVEVGTDVATRHLRRVVDRRGRLTATVVDSVDDTLPRRRRTLEVVPVPGRRHEARRLARALRRGGATPARAGGEQPTRPPAPRTALDVAAAAIGDGLGRLLAHDPELRRSGGIEAVHQARVATRRLRSDLRTLADVLDPEATGHLREELRWLGSRLGAVRDADVLGARLADRTAAAPDLPGAAALVGRCHDQREGAMAELSVTLDSPRYFALLDDLAAAATAPPRRRRHQVAGPRPGVAPGWARRRPAARPGDRATRALPVLVGRPWRRLRRDVRALPATPPDDELHQVRIRAKELRYAAELATPVLGRRAATVAGAAKDLQTVLGDLHDAVVAEGWLRDAAIGAAPEVAFAAGVLVAQERAEQERLRRAWSAAWRPVAHSAARLRP